MNKYGIGLDGRKVYAEQALRGHIYICPYCFEKLHIVRCPDKNCFRHNPIQNRTPQQMLCPWYTGNGSNSGNNLSETDKLYIVNGGVPLHLVERESSIYELVALFPPLSKENMDYLLDNNVKVQIKNDGMEEVISAWNLRRYRVKTTNKWIKVNCLNLKSYREEIHEKWEWGIKGLTFDDDLFMCDFGGGVRVAQHSNIVVGKEYLFVHRYETIRNQPGLCFKKKGRLSLRNMTREQTYDVYSLVVTDVTDEAIKYIQTKGYHLIEKSDDLIPLWPPAVMEGKELIYSSDAGDAYLYHKKEGTQKVFQWGGIFTKQLFEKNDIVKAATDNRLLVLTDQYSELSREIRFFLTQSRKNYDKDKTFVPHLYWKKENGTILEFYDIGLDNLQNEELICKANHDIKIIISHDGFIEKSTNGCVGKIQLGRKIFIVNEPFGIYELEIKRETKEEYSVEREKIINVAIDKLYHCHSTYVQVGNCLDRWIIMANELSDELCKILMYFKSIGRMPHMAETILTEMEKTLYEAESGL